MPQNVWGPVNITRPNSAFFTAEFYDSNGNTTVPAGASIAITYINTSNASQTDTVTLAQTGSFFTGLWSSSLAKFGIARWSVTATGNSSASQTGEIRVLDP